MAHGLLLVDKCPEMTSHDVVARVRRILKTKAVGHAGTLDPIASGLMVLLIGDGTKLSNYLLSQDKAYEVNIKLGLITDTLDRAGKILKESPTGSLLKGDILKAVEGSCGELELQVPHFSAIKVKGQKLYEKARKDLDFEPPLKKMKFYDIKVLEVKENEIRASLRCSKGSYIRSWVSLIGEKLGCGAIVEELRRTESQPYNVSQTLTLEELEKAVQGDGVIDDKPQFIPIVKALPHWKILTIKGKDEKLLLNGQISHSLFQRLIYEQKQANKSMKSVGIKVISADQGRLLSLLEAQPAKGLKIKKVFNSSIH